MAKTCILQPLGDPIPPAAISFIVPWSKAETWWNCQANDNFKQPRCWKVRVTLLVIYQNSMTTQVFDLYNYCFISIFMYIYIYIRRPRPSPRQGRRLGPPQVWSLFLFATTLPSARHSGHCPLLLRAFKPAVCHLKRCAAASSRRSRRCPLLLRAFKPAVCQASNAQNAARPLQAGTPATALCC